MRHRLIEALVAVLGIAAIGVTASAPVDAARSSNNSYTQMDNSNWPAGSSNPDCSPCVQWPGHEYNLHYSYRINGPSLFHTDTQDAVNEWSGQPYQSPAFSEDGTDCYNGGYDALCFDARSLASNVCGNTEVSWDGNGIITFAVVHLNSNQRYSDGPTTSGCDVRNTLRHEIGHAFSEGHSSVSADLMYPSNNNVEVVDADAQQELDDVYGPYSSSACGSASTTAGVSAVNCSTSALLSNLQSKLLSHLIGVGAPGIHSGTPG